MDFLSALPEDIFNEVVSYLNPVDILKASKAVEDGIKYLDSPMNVCKKLL